MCTLKRYPRLWIGPAEVLFTDEVPSEEYALVHTSDTRSVSRAKVLKKVETDKFIAVITSEPETTFRRFVGEFEYVEAAGGVVCDERGELLMIRLRGRWDLPKGHVEAHESSSAAALREVEEECGVKGELVGDEPLAETWHAYDTYGRWELKCTRWWQMRAAHREPVPQHDEGITEARWCDTEQVDECLKTSYETIKRVVAALRVKSAQ